MKKEKKQRGAPRTVSLSDDGMSALGKEMVDWVKSHPDTIHLSQWYTIEKGFTYNQWKTFITIKSFFPYYEQALKIIGIKYLDSTINSSISQRWQRIYFKDLREQEDEDLRMKIEMEAKNRSDIPPLSHLVELENETMKLRAELAKAKEKIQSLENK